MLAFINVAVMAGSDKSDRQRSIGTCLVQVTRANNAYERIGVLIVELDLYRSAAKRLVIIV
jgi:hypothetical protein